MITNGMETVAAADARKRCTGDGVAEGVNVSLSVVGGGATVPIKKSARSKWRAATLILVHVVIIGHLIHYAIAGRTLSPVEPSESMFTLELGQVNAGVIFFAAALLGTVIFGRFFCGWGCHLVAYQDLCSWIMKKLGVKPKPFRSRLLVFVPLGVALYMFVWPTVKRLVLEPSRSHPGFTNHLATTDFWVTFPGPGFAILTLLVCGFAAVYFLGAKGFCTYGCPYGGFFSLLDRAAPGKILVTDACEQCGHCTATCTSNVRVHEEVKLYGMVVDPGCMKCMDCISVCPNGALYYGFGSPSILRSPSNGTPKPRRYDFTWPEEIALAVVFLASTLAFRGLYDGPPFLLSVGLGGITAYVAVKLWRVFQDPTVRIQNLRIKSAGKLGLSGWVFAIGAATWLAFGAHSGFVQWHRVWGAHYFKQTEATETEVFAGRATVEERYSDRHYDAVTKGLGHLASADRWGLVDVVSVKRQLAWMYLLVSEDAKAEQRIREAIAVDPENERLYADLVNILLKRGRPEEAIAALEQRMARGGPSAADHLRLANLLAQQNRVSDAIEHYESSLALAPELGAAHYNLGGLLGRLGRALRLTVDDSVELDWTDVEDGSAGLLARAFAIDLANVRKGDLVVEVRLEVAGQDPIVRRVRIELVEPAEGG